MTYPPAVIGERGGRRGIDALLFARYNALMTNNMTMTERKARVAELVARFKRDEASYKASTFNEASTRGQFLNAFLEALGWDVGNAGGALRILSCH